MLQMAFLKPRLPHHPNFNPTSAENNGEGGDRNWGWGQKLRKAEVFTVFSLGVKHSLRKSKDSPCILSSVPLSLSLVLHIAIYVFCLGILSSVFTVVIYCPLVPPINLLE